MSQPKQESRRASASKAVRPPLKRKGTSSVLNKPEAKTRKVADKPPERQCIAYFSVHAADGDPEEYAKYPKLECVRYKMRNKPARTVPGYIFDCDEGNEQYLDFEYKIEEGAIQPDPGFVFRVAAVSSGIYLYGFGQFIKVPWQDCAIERSTELKIDTEFARKADQLRRTRLACMDVQHAAKGCRARLQTMALPVAPTTTRMVSSTYRQNIDKF